MKPLKMTTLAKNEIEVEREFNASAALLWRAMTEPELVKKWMNGQSDHSMPVCEMDVRVGGKLRLVWHMPQGEMAMQGEFRNVEAPTFLVHSEVFDDWPDNSSLVTQTLRENGDTTLLTVLIAYDNEKARDAVLRTGIETGMENCYGNLDALLVELLSSEAERAAATNQRHPDI